MMKIAAGYQKDPFTGRIRYPGEMYEEFDQKAEKQKEAERQKETEKQKEIEKPKRAKKGENE